MLKLIPIAGAVTGAVAGAFIDTDPLRGALAGIIGGATGLPVALWLLWVAVVKLFGVRVQ